MAFVQTNEHGVMISRPDKQQQIGLTGGEWARLGVYADKITAFMARVSRDEEAWHSLADPDTSRISTAEPRVTLNYYNGSPYCNIRMYAGGNPSKQGVTLNDVQWASVCACLGHGPEVAIARDAYEKLLREVVVAARQKLCEGCREGWLSQKDHECLSMTGGRMLTQRVLVTKPGVNLYDFQCLTCGTARERQVAMKTSLSELYGLCNTHFRAEMEDCLLADDLSSGAL